MGPAGIFFHENICSNMLVGWFERPFETVLQPISGRLYANTVYICLALKGLASTVTPPVHPRSKMYADMTSCSFNR